MAELLIFIAVMLLVSFLGLVFFAGYMGLVLLRTVGRLLGWLGRVVFGQGSAGALMRRCPRESCGEANPTHARYCRRCGRAMAGEVEVRRGRGTGRVGTWSAVPPVGSPVGSVGSGWRRERGG